jgi:hypothetical protein
MNRCAAIAVAGRHRIELLIGGAHAVLDPPPVVSANHALDGFGGFQYTTFLREDLGLTFAVRGRGGESGTLPSGVATSSGTGLIAIPAGVRWNPITSRRPASAVKPFVAATIGPIFASGSLTSIGPSSLANAHFHETTIGGDAIAGIDFHPARPLSIGVSGGYNWMGTFARPIGLLDNYGGPEVGVSVGFLFGKGR